MSASFDVIFSPEAEAELLAIYSYISDVASPRVAKSFTDSIVDCCEALKTFPERGSKRDDLRPGLRLLGFRRRVTIAFVCDARQVIVVGIFYGGRDVESRFDDHDP